MEVCYSANSPYPNQVEETSRVAPLVSGSRTQSHACLYLGLVTMLECCNSQRSYIAANDRLSTEGVEYLLEHHNQWWHATRYMEILAKNIPRLNTMQRYFHIKQKQRTYIRGLHQQSLCFTIHNMTTNYMFGASNTSFAHEICYFYQSRAHFGS